MTEKKLNTHCNMLLITIYITLYHTNKQKDSLHEVREVKWYNNM